LIVFKDKKNNDNNINNVVKQDTVPIEDAINNNNKIKNAIGSSLNYSLSYEKNKRAFKWLKTDAIFSLPIYNEVNTTVLFVKELIVFLDDKNNDDNNVVMQGTVSIGDANNNNNNNAIISRLKYSLPYENIKRTFIQLKTDDIVNLQ